MNNNKGTIYLIQPAELVGTNRYKIGCSAKNDLERCTKGYKKGTRFMDIRECEYPFALEREVKTCFNSKFSLIAGKEYFEGNETDIKKEFNDIVSKFTLLKSDDFENNFTSTDQVSKTLLIENDTINKSIINAKNGKDNELISKTERIKLEEQHNKAIKKIVDYNKRMRFRVDKKRPKTFEQVFLRDTLLHHNKGGNNEYVLWLKDNQHFRRCNFDKSFKSDETFVNINAFTCKNYENKNKTREKPRTIQNNAFLETFFLNDIGVWCSCDELIENKTATNIKNDTEK
jgi:hypothetical protein